MNDERRYSQAELRAIFERAAERQEAASRAEAASAGELTLGELQEIGAASGIDPAHIAAAVRELAMPTPVTKGVLGYPTEVRRTRFVPHAISDEAWEQMVAELRRTFHQPGMAGGVGRVREWTTQARRRHGAAVHVMLEPEAGGTRITVEQSLRGSSLGFIIAGGAYAVMALLFGIFLATGIFESSDAFVPVMFAALAVVMFGGSRLGFGLYADRQEKRFEHALDRLDLIARDAETTPAAALSAPAAPQESGRIDLDSLPENEDEQARSGRSRTRS